MTSSVIELNESAVACLSCNNMCSYLRCSEVFTLDHWGHTAIIEKSRAVWKAIAVVLHSMHFLPTDRAPFTSP